jgi:hypothetical protein
VPSSAGASASGDFILDVRALYLLARDEVQRTQRTARPAFTSHALSAYILAVAAVEASINELFLSEFSDQSFTDNPVVDEHLRELLEQEDLISKLLILPQLAFGKGLSRDKQPMQDMSMLVNLRNQLVHYKMSGKTPSFVHDLARRKIAIQPPEEGVSPWLPKVSTLEGIAWAHRTACRTVREIIALFPEDKRPLELFVFSENFAEKHEAMFQ